MYVLYTCVIYVYAIRVGGTCTWFDSITLLSDLCPPKSIKRNRHYKTGL